MEAVDWYKANLQETEQKKKVVFMELHQIVQAHILLVVTLHAV